MKKLSHEKMARVEPVIRDLTTLRNQTRKAMREFEAKLKGGGPLGEAERKRYEIEQMRAQEIGNLRGSILGIRDPESPLTEDDFEEMLEYVGRMTRSLKEDPDSAGNHTQFIGSDYWARHEQRR